MGDFVIKNGILQKYQGPGGDVSIPDGVKEIGAWVFSDCTSLTSVTIPEGVTEIGEKAFSDCTSLTSVTIPDGVAVIDYRAFSGCKKLTSVTIPKGITEIGNYAFSGCTRLTSVTIPEGVKVIGSEAFSDCKKLTGVTIPEGVTEIDSWAFSGCSSLTSVTIPDGVKEIDWQAFSDCTSLTSVTIPEGVKVIGREAFSGCKKLTSVTIPEGVTEIGSWAFSNCTSLTSVTIPESATEIDSWAFSGCTSLTSVTIPESVTKIGSWAFSGCSSLTSVTIPESVKQISRGAFDGCAGLQDPDGFVIVKGVLFDFMKKDAVRVTIPEGVKEIGASAFSGCKKLTSVTIPEGVKVIDDSAFFDCKKLASVTIPESVTGIGDGAFSGCRALTSVHFTGGYPKLRADVFEGCNKLRMPLDALRTDHQIPAQLAQFFPQLTVEETVYILLFQTHRVWREKAEAGVTEENADQILESMTRLIRERTKLSDKAMVRAAEFVEKAADIRTETLRALEAALEEKKGDAALEIVRRTLTERDKLGGKSSAPKNPTEALVQEKWIVSETVKRLKGEIKSGIPYVGSEELSSPEAVIFVISAYVKQIPERRKGIRIGEYKSGYFPLQVNTAADQVAAALDREALLKQLELLVYDKEKMDCVAALGRYADEARAATLVTWIRKWADWNQYNIAGRQNIMIARGALMLNDTHAAMLHMEKVGQLEAYAKLRGTDAETLRATKLTDFGFDQAGKKTYDLGGATVTASLGPDLKITLFDETAGKAVKSLPKKGADPEKYAAAGADLSALKKNVKSTAKARSDRLFQDFLSGHTEPANRWKRAYLENPLLRRVAQLLVWSQGKQTFTLGPDGPIQSNGAAYAIQKGPIGVAHPMEMDPAEVAAWQRHFMANGLKQPFEQVWEPVVDPKTIQPDRYEGEKVFVFRFMHMEKHGIHFYDEDFHSLIKFNLDDCGLSCERTTFHRHEIAPDETFTLGRFSFKTYTRRVNHIVALLDRWTVAGRILKDDVTVRGVLGAFTAAQIMEYIRLATENGCVNCGAMLLEYKKEHYPDFDPLAEFTLE